jgi:predicted RNA-binding protein
MRIIAEDILGNKDECHGKHVRLTRIGCFVDDVYWHGPAEGVFVIDVMEESK